MDRRHVINGGIFSGLACLIAPGSAVAAQRSDDSAVAQAVGRLTDVLLSTRDVSPELARIRGQQRTFLKANQKFPDYLEIGVGVWENICDWHIRHQLPLTINRTTDGRYTITVMQTTLILRPDQTDSYIGFGFDAR